MRFLQNITFYKFEKSGVMMMMMMMTTACSVIDCGIGLNKKRLVNCNHNTNRKQRNRLL